jgi:hypothetical protein
MPVKPVYRARRLYGYQWGGHGKLYTISKYGKTGAKKKAVIQAKAIFASGYKGDSR